MRGQLRSLTSSIGSCRIISARAGPTQDVLTISLWNSDHPRSCGANFRLELEQRGSIGSSPLVRGQPCLKFLGLGLARIIPARAGPTPLSDWVWLTLPDHPRSCGANKGSPCRSRSISGSSPLVRGQLLEVVLHSQEVRIIPARAGPTTRCRTSRETHTDHPRSCGANHISIRKPKTGGGSSVCVQ